MAKKVLWFILLAALLVFLASGCFAPAQFGAPGRTVVRGTVAMPEGNSCFAVVCSQPEVSEGHVPVPQGTLTLYGEGGDLVTAQTDSCGKYEVVGLQDSCYILYAQVPGGSARVKKGFTVEEGKMNDVGEANVYTTAQVIIYEVAVEQYGKEVVKCSDIPGFIPTPALLEAVRNALLRCHDPQKDCTVLALARSIATGYFGAPGGGGTTGGGGGTEEPKGSITVKLYCNNPCEVDNKPPVSGATVIVAVQGSQAGENLTKHSDASGICKFENLPLGTYSIFVEKEGYESLGLQEVTLTQNDLDKTVEIGLTPKREVTLLNTNYDGPTTESKIKIPEEWFTLGGECWNFFVRSCDGGWTSFAYCGTPNAISVVGRCYRIQDVYVAENAINWLVNQDGAFNGDVLKPEYMVAIWKLLGYRSGISCTVDLYNNYGQSADDLVSEALERSETWSPCPGGKVVIVIDVKENAQDILVIAEIKNDWNPCP